MAAKSNWLEQWSGEIGMRIAQNLIVPHPEGSFSLLLTFSLSTYVLDLASCDQQIKTSIILAGH